MITALNRWLRKRMDKRRWSFTCPDCGCHAYLEGPSGGMSQNVECANCGQRWNAILGDVKTGWFGSNTGTIPAGTIPYERISHREGPPAGCGEAKTGYCNACHQPWSGKD